MNKITVLTIRQQMIILAVGVSLLSYVFYMGLIAPQSERISNLENQRDSDRVQLAVVDDFSLQHPQLDAYLADLDQKIVQTNDSLPSDPAVSAFVIQIQQVARDTQVVVSRIAPGPYLNKTAYYEIPVEVGVRGSFFNVVAFIQRCESLGRFTSIATVNIQVKQGLLECKIPLVIYTFGTAPLQTGAAPSQPKPAVPPTASATK